MFKKQLLMIVFTLCALMSYAQVEIKGLVYDEYLEPFYNAKITLNGKTTTSNQDGEFVLVLKKELPAVLKVTAFGYQDEEVLITSLEKSVKVILKESFLLDQIVISASRVPERIIESPVTIERFGLVDIKKTSSNSFYDGLVNLKGIQSREGSYGFKSINTRGFSDFSNSRFVQMIDGMDTASQALSFSTGNFSGVSELDIKSVEILPGAASALYGANAYNGLMLMNTKNPFDYTGISTMFKSGYMSQKEGGNNPFYDVAVRMAYKFSESFAAKVNLSYYEAEEWHANDLRRKEVDTNELKYDLIADGNGGVKAADPSTLIDYDGINTYGDEQFQDLFQLNSSLPAGTEDNKYGTYLRRTGYTERELLKNNFKTNNVRFSGSLYFRPFKDDRLQIELSSRFSLRDNLFQGTSRFAQRGYFTEQHKFEVKGTDFYVRAYYTGNDSGRSYDLTRTGIELNSAVDNNTSFRNRFFVEKYFNGKTNKEARVLADVNRLIPNTSSFNNEFNRITSTLLSEGGSALYERSSYKHVGGNYNFKRLLNDWADIQVGGSYRQYNPNSKGTLFNDALEEINIEEFGFYSQIQKKMFNERLKVTASLRYDKADNFDGNYSPKVALNYNLGEDNNHVLRASYQTGFRNPTVQEQYMLLNPAVKTTVGTVKDNLDRISLESIYSDFDNTAGYFLTTRNLTGDEIINNSLLTKTVYFDADTYKGNTYEKSTYGEVMPEVVKTFELGYRSMFRLNNNTNFDLDVNAYYSKHDNFIFTQDVVTPNGGKVYPFGNRKLTADELLDPNNSFGYIVDGVLVLDDIARRAFFDDGNTTEFNIITNSKSNIESYGFALGTHTKLFKNFDFGINYAFNDYSIEDKDNGQFEPNFNTPKHMVKAEFGNNKLFKNFGFNINARWSDKYKWVSTFVRGDVDARTVIDAQLNYRIPSMKSKFKIGGTNLFGKEYFVAPGSGQIGQLYYISWVINN